MGLRILWFSNAPWTGTGYGQQTAQAWWRIQKLGHKIVAIAANYGHEGSPLSIEQNGETTQVLGRGYNPHGIDIIGAHAQASKADIVITLYDSWIFDPRMMQNLKWVPWLPVDHDPCPPQIKQVLQAAYQPICFAKFGVAKLQEAGLDPVYVPHGIETSIFKPGDKQKARERWGMSGYDFVAVMVAANKGSPSRKSFGETFKAWRKFLDKHPNSLLYCHSYTGKEMNGEDLMGLGAFEGIPPENLKFADKYYLLMTYPQEQLAELYRAADVLLSPSKGEGFGVPIVEAQACGCPVITGNWTSMPELTFGGWLVEGQAQATPLLANQWIPNIGSIVEALEEAYKHQGSDAIKRKAINGARDYDADLVCEKYWKPVLANIEEMVKSAAVKQELVVF